MQKNHEPYWQKPQQRTEQAFVTLASALWLNACLVDRICLLRLHLTRLWEICYLTIGHNPPSHSFILVSLVLLPFLIVLCCSFVAGVSVGNYSEIRSMHRAPRIVESGCFVVISSKIARSSSFRFYILYLLHPFARKLEEHGGYLIIWSFDEVFSILYVQKDQRFLGLSSMKMLAFFRPMITVFVDCK